MAREVPVRVLIAKPGLDGHDRGAKAVSLALRDAGMEVVYTGLHQSVERIVEAAIQEDVDVIGLSILSGAHRPIVKGVLEELKAKGAEDKVVIVGGSIPRQDIPVLRKMGVAGVFPTGSRFEDIATFIEAEVGRRSRRG